MPVVEVDATHAVPRKTIHLPQENSIVHQREICNGKANKTPDGLPISLGQVQNEQIR